MASAMPMPTCHSHPFHRFLFVSFFLSLHHLVLMDVPIGFLAKLWSFLSFLPFFFSLLVLGLLKAVIICPFATCIIFVGNSAVVVGLWPAHCLWTYYCVVKSKRLGLLLKVLVILVLPLPLLLWPVLSIVGSLLVGFGYGFFAPLIATFEAVGEQVVDKLVHCFIDGCWSTVEGSCTVVRDFTDFCFHSYFSYMDDLIEMLPLDEKPMEIKISKLPSCLLVSICGIIVDVPLLLLLALWKSPFMLLKGWTRLFEDLVGREGPFLETVCVPFAALAVILWPIIVVAAVIGAFISSLFLAVYGGVIVYQENSLRMGLAYIVSIISIFDEYTNDMLYMREGSYLPRPVYRKTLHRPSKFIQRHKSAESDKTEETNGSLDGSHDSKLSRGRSKTLKNAIGQLKPMQLWDWLFRSCELNGRILLDNGLINVSDIKECMYKGGCKNLTIKLPAYCILQCLFRSAKSNSPGFLISEDVEVTKVNWPEDKVFEWFLGPLLIMKDQIQGLQLNECEEACISKLFMCHSHDKPDDWDESGFPSDDNVKRAQLQAIFRRLQGIFASLSRMPTFRRRFRNLVRILYLDAVERGLLGTREGNVKPGNELEMTDSEEMEKSVHVADHLV